MTDRWFNMVWMTWLKRGGGGYVARDEGWVEVREYFSWEGDLRGLTDDREGQVREKVVRRLSRGWEEGNIGGGVEKEYEGGEGERGERVEKLRERRRGKRGRERILLTSAKIIALQSLLPSLHPHSLPPIPDPAYTTSKGQKSPLPNDHYFFLFSCHSFYFLFCIYWVFIKYCFVF